MNFKKFVKEFETYYEIDTSSSILEKYIIPIIPTFGKFLIDLCSENKINHEYYMSMFISLLFPIIINDFLKITITKAYGNGLVSVIIDNMDNNKKNFENNLKLIFNNELLKIDQVDKNKKWFYCDNKMVNFFIEDKQCYNIFIYIDNLEYNFFLCCKDKKIFIHGKSIDKLNIITKFVLNYKKKENDICNLHESEIKPVIKNIYNYNNLILSNSIMKQLNDKLDNFTNPIYNEKMKSLGFKNNLHLHFHGIPGSGKTSMAMAIANKLNKDIILVDKLNPEFFFNNLDLFKNKSYVFLFDDIDFWDLKDRQIIDKQGITKSNPYLMKLMELLNGNTFNNSIMIFTSNTDNFNKALFRDGRIHLRLDINGIDDVSTYNKFFEIIYDDKNQTWKNKINLDKLLNKKLSLAKISEIAKNNIFSKNNFIKELIKLI